MSEPQQSDRRLESAEIRRQPGAASRETNRPAGSVPAVAGQFTDLPVTFGRYQVQTLLGRGAMGSVYLAQDTQLGRAVALKIPNVAASGSKRLLIRLETEAKAAAQLDHPSLCKVFDAGEVGGQCFIAMQYIDGETLKAQLDVKSKSVAEAVSLIVQLSEGLSEAHDLGIIHRDLKPENIMINRRGTPVIMDFGLAKFSTISSNAFATQAGTILGSPAYMSPEQASGNSKEIDQRSDIYALGTILFELLTGELPFTGSAMQILGQKSILEPASPINLKPDLPPQLAAICHKMIARNNVDRYQTLAEVIVDLKRIDLNRAPPGAMAVAIPIAQPVSSDPFAKFVVYEQVERATAPVVDRRSGTTNAIRRSAVATSTMRQRVRAWWNRRTPAVKWAAVVGPAAFVLVLGVVLFFPTRYGTLQIDIEDPSLSVRFDGDSITIDNAGQPMQVTPNDKHRLEILQNGVTIESATRSLTVKRGEKRLVTLQLSGKEILIDGKRLRKTRRSTAPISLIDVLPLLKPENIVQGNWNIQPNFVESVGAQHHAQIILPVNAPEEYTVHIEAARLDTPETARHTFGVGFACGKSDCFFAMETDPPNGFSGLHLVDGVPWNANETTIPISYTTIGKPFRLDVIVRKDQVEVRVDDRQIVDWRDLTRLQRDAAWDKTPPRSLFLGAESGYRITQIKLGPPLPPRELPGKDLRIGESVELLKSVDLRRDVWNGPWLQEGLAMKSDPATPFARFSVPYETPEEYELVAGIECYQAGHEFYLGLPFQLGHAGVVLGSTGGEKNFLTVDAKIYQGKPALVSREGRVFSTEKSTVTAVVRRNRLEIKVGEVVIFDWHGDPRRFLPTPFATPGNRVTIGTHHAGYRITSLKLTRLAESPPFPAPLVPQNGDLLSIIDLDRDIVLGNWQKVGRRLQSSALNHSGILFRAQLPVDYQFRLVLERKSGNEQFQITLPIDGDPLSIVLDNARGTHSGIRAWMGRVDRDNPTTIHQSTLRLPIGERRVLTGTISGRLLKVALDGEKLWDVEVPSELQDIPFTIRPQWLNATERLQMYLASKSSQFEIHEVRIGAIDKNLPEFPPFDLTATAPAAPPIPGERTLVVWHVGSPNSEDIPSTSVDEGVAREARKLGCVLAVKGFREKGFRDIFWNSFETHIEPDFVVFEAEATKNDCFDRASIRQKGKQVFGDLNLFKGKRRFVISSSRNYQLARELDVPSPVTWNLNSPAPTAGQLSPQDITAISDRSIRAFEGYVKGGELGVADYADKQVSVPHRIASLFSKNPKVSVSATRVLGVRGCGRVAIAPVTAILENDGFGDWGYIHRHTRLCVFRKMDGVWKLLSISEQAEDLAMWERIIAGCDEGSGAVQPPKLLSPADGVKSTRFPPPDLEWIDSGRSVSAYVVEMQSLMDGNWHSNCCRGILRKETTSKGLTCINAPLKTGMQPHRWRVWAIGQSGGLAISTWRVLNYMN